jgi:hypothetical protein
MRVYTQLRCCAPRTFARRAGMPGPFVIPQIMKKDTKMANAKYAPRSGAPHKPRDHYQATGCGFFILRD